MITTEQMYSLQSHNLIVTAKPFNSGVEIQAFNQGDNPGEIQGGKFAKPAAMALARLAGVHVKVLFGDKPNSDQAPPQRAVEAITHFAATLGNITDGESTFVSPGNVIVEMDTTARAPLESLGFPFTEDCFREANGYQQAPAVPISQIHNTLAPNFPEEFAGPTVVQPR